MSLPPQLIAPDLDEKANSVIRAAGDAFTALADLYHDRDPSQQSGREMSLRAMAKRMADHLPWPVIRDPGTRPPIRTEPAALTDPSDALLEATR